MQEERLPVALSHDHEEFVCAICIGLCISPISLPCEHMFCQTCLRRVMTLKCPSCRAPFEQTDFERPPRLVMTLLLKQPVRCSRCNEQMSLEAWISHVSRPCGGRCVEDAVRTYLDGPPTLQHWQSPCVTVVTHVFKGPRGLWTKKGNDLCLSIKAASSTSCVGWASHDLVIISIEAMLQVWSISMSQERAALKYTLLLHGGVLRSFAVIPRSGLGMVRYAAIAAVHVDGHLRLHSLPILAGVADGAVLREDEQVPISPFSDVESVNICNSHDFPNRLVLGHTDGSVRWMDLPSNPELYLPSPEGCAGAGFLVESVGFCPRGGESFWAIGRSASVAIGDIQEKFSEAPVHHGDNRLTCADSSDTIQYLLVGGVDGHVWALPWLDHQATPPRLLFSFGSAVTALKCHPFLPVALAGCVDGSACELWLHSKEQMTHIIDVEEHLDSQSCISIAWAPDLNGRCAIARAGGIVHIGTVHRFPLEISSNNVTVDATTI